MDDEQLLRYSRQIMLPGFGIEGQERLGSSRVLIVGMGGLGAPAAMYLAAAGVGELLIADFDRVDLSNLQRQIIHYSGDIGRPKVDSARETLLALNPEVRVTALDERLDADALRDLAADCDAVLDASDNFVTRFAVNRACVEAGTPLVSGAAVRLEGQVSVFKNTPQSPCYQCLYPEGEELDQTCAENGVLAPVVGIIGSIQATEAIKLLSGVGQPLYGRLLVLDAATMEWRSLRLNKDPACPVCGKRPEAMPD